MSKKKRPSYSHGIEIIALNDESGADECMQVDFVSSQISVCLLADLYGIPPEDVAIDVIKFRKRESEKEMKQTGEG